MSQSSKSQHTPFILYIGAPERSEALCYALEARGGFVYQPDELMEALAMYITYMPDAIVVDGEYAPYAAEALEHFLDVKAAPIIFLAAKDIPAWASKIAYRLPADLTAPTLIDHISAIVAQVPSTFRDYDYTPALAPSESC